MQALDFSTRMTQTTLLGTGYFYCLRDEELPTGTSPTRAPRVSPLTSSLDY